jgi:hypothetical protein
VNEEIDEQQCASFPHVRLSPERAAYYFERVNTLIDDILQETPNPDGKVYGILVSMFMAPEYIQGTGISTPLESSVADEEEG